MPRGLQDPVSDFSAGSSFDSDNMECCPERSAGAGTRVLAVPILGSDVSGSALEMARKNADRAGVGGLVSFSRAGIGECDPPSSPGILLCNPPYGVRLGDEESLKLLYKKLGDTLKKSFQGYTAYVLTGNPQLASCIGLRPSRRIVLFNGPIECRLLKYEVY